MYDYLKKLITPDMVFFGVPTGPSSIADLTGKNPKGQCFGTHPNVPVIAPPIEQINACDATANWTTHGSLSIDTSDKKEGTGSLKTTYASPVIGSYYNTFYYLPGTEDWSDKEDVLFWIISDRASTAFSAIKLVVFDTLGNWRYWLTAFSATTWTAIKQSLSSWTSQSAVAPDFTSIDKISVEFKPADETPFYFKLDDIRVTGKPSLINPSVGWVFGGDDEIRLSSKPVPATGPFAVSAWINQAILISPGTIYGQYTTGNVDRFLLYVKKPGGNLAFHIGAEDLFSTQLISSGHWYYVSFVREADNTIRIYINGVLNISDTNSSDVEQKNGQIGMGGTQYWWKGNIAFLSIANEPWSLQQHNNIYLATKGMFAPRG